MKNIITILLFLPCFLFAQSNGSIKGKLLDEQNQAIAYATISLFDAEEKFILGAISSETGTFKLEQLPYGQLNLEIQFLGFETTRKSIVLNTKNRKTNLGNIVLKPDLKQLEEVQVIGEKSDYNLRLDKKVFNVGKDVLSQGGSAIDILDQVPLVTVNANGGVELRGSSQVQILINGKRSGLTMNNALDQIPGENIERVEVITNPSARFDAAGSAGIINIILKKNKGMGWNGQLRLRAGIPADHIIMPGINYKGKKINVFSNFRWRYSDYNGTYITEQRTTNNGITSFLDQREIEDRHDDGRSGYIGVDYDLDKNNSVTIAYFRAETTDTDETLLTYQLNNEGQNSTEILTNGNSLEHRNYNQLESNFTHQFNEEGRKLTFDFQYDFWNSTKDWDLTTSGDGLTPNIPNQIRTTNKAGSQDYVLKSDYIHPLKNGAAIETGVKIENRIVNNDYLAELYSNDNWVTYENLDNDVKYSEKIAAAYLQYQGKVKKLEYMIGLRSEYTLLNIKDDESQFTNDRDYLKLFPSMHLSYSFSENNTIQWSYARRINRPRLWSLYPFSEIKDFNLQQIGNPNLQAAFAHALEVAYLGVFDKLTINPAIYYRYTTNPFSEFLFRDDKETFILQPINIDQKEKLGFELSIRYRPVKAISLSAEFNFFHFEEKGTYEGLNLDASSNTWSARGNANFNLPKGFKLQSRFTYYASEKRAQIKELASYQLSFGLSKNFLDDKLSISFRARNVLDSRAIRSISETADYRIEHSRKRIRERFSLGAVYKFNQTQRQRAREAKRGNR